MDRLFEGSIGKWFYIQCFVQCNFFVNSVPIRLWLSSTDVSTNMPYLEAQKVDIELTKKTCMYTVFWAEHWKKDFLFNVIFQKVPNMHSLDKSLCSKGGHWIDKEDMESFEQSIGEMISDCDHHQQAVIITNMHSLDDSLCSKGWQRRHRVLEKLFQILIIIKLAERKTSPQAKRHQPSLLITHCQIINRV